MRVLLCCCVMLLFGCTTKGFEPLLQAREVTSLRTEPATVAAGAATEVFFDFRNDAHTDDVPHVSMHCSAGTIYAITGENLTSDGTMPTKAELDALVAAAHLPDVAHGGDQVSNSVLAQYFWVAPATPGTYEIAADMKGAFNTGEMPDETISVVVY